MIERFRTDRDVNREPVWLTADAVVALALGFLTVSQMTSDAAVAEFGEVEGLGWVLVLGPTALLLVRRVVPATALAAAAVLYLLAGVDHVEGNALLAASFLAYTVAVTRPVRDSATITAAAAVPVSLTAFYGPGGIDPLVVPVSLFFFGIGWVVGVQVRKSQIRQHELAEKAEATREEVAEIARRAVADERLRIARDLHDAVGHAVNVMVMQAGAARLASRDERTAQSLHDIERVGRSALSDLDRMLGLLDRSDGDGVPLEPTHGLADIARLVEGVRATGADVHLADGCSGVIDPAIERPIGAAAYRIVQEALTNAVKHAGPARIEVSLRCDDDEIVVSVADNGRGAAAAPTGVGGRGIVGMKERVSVLGGRLSAQPRVGGGFAVTAHLPRMKER
ncbi:MAG: sensor histidine kinase [Acidimicrobiales bacterium]